MDLNELDEEKPIAKKLHIVLCIAIGTGVGVSLGLVFGGDQGLVYGSPVGVVLGYLFYQSDLNSNRS